jgi:effector-binding domain-containing protein
MTDVRITELDELRVVSALGFGEQPEDDAWRMILDFAAVHGLDPFCGEHRFFGFNNPDPSPGSPEYGYEQWMTVGPEVEAEAPYEIKTVPPGRYAVMGVEGLHRIGEQWAALLGWFEQHGYQLPLERERCLEELLTPIDLPPEEWRFDLYVGLSE